MTSDETADSFSPLKLDAFHALCERYHGAAAAPRPPGQPTRGARDVASRDQASQLFLLGTPAGREFVNSGGQPKIFKANVFDFEYPDGDWEELTRRETDVGMGVAARPSFLA